MPVDCKFSDSASRIGGYFNYQDGFSIPSGQGSNHLILYGGSNSTVVNAFFVGGTNNSELGPGGTELTNSHTSSNNTLRVVVTLIIYVNLY